MTKQQKELWNEYFNYRADAEKRFKKVLKKFSEKTPSAEELKRYGYDVAEEAVKSSEWKERLRNAGFSDSTGKWIGPDGTDLSNKGLFKGSELASDPEQPNDGRIDIMPPAVNSDKVEKAKTATMSELQDIINDYFAESEKTKSIPVLQTVKDDLSAKKDSCIKSNAEEFALNTVETEQLKQYINNEFAGTIYKSWNKSYEKSPREVVNDPRVQVTAEEAVEIEEKYKDGIKGIKEKALMVASNMLSKFEENKELPQKEAFEKQVSAYINQCVHLSEFISMDATEKERNYIKELVYNNIIGGLFEKYDRLADMYKVTDRTPGQICSGSKDIRQDGSVSNGGAAKRKETSQVLSNYARTNVSFSGCDMVVTAEMVTTRGVRVSVMVGEAQTVTYSVFRKLSPILNIGNINAKDYVGGPRTIAGTLIMTVFNQHWGTQLIDKFGKSEGYASSRKVLMDELAPMNITISMANEYGICSRLAIYGVRIFSEGQVMSINDIFTENTFQYVALNMDYLADINTKDDLRALYRGTTSAKPKPVPKPSKDGVSGNKPSGDTLPNKGGGDSQEKDGKIIFDTDEHVDVPIMYGSQKQPSGFRDDFNGFDGESISYTTCGDNRQAALTKASNMKKQYEALLKEQLGNANDSISVSQDSGSSSAAANKNLSRRELNKRLDQIKNWYDKTTTEINQHYDVKENQDIISIGDISV